jgi:hypothetical protein
MFIVMSDAAFIVETDFQLHISFRAPILRRSTSACNGSKGHIQKAFVPFALWKKGTTPVS